MKNIEPRKVMTSGGVVLNKLSEVLVVNQHNDSWSLPKGHVEKGESFEDTARREITEESGIKNLTMIKSLPSYERFRIALGGGEDRTELKTIHMFLFKTNEMTLLPIDPENPEARWVPKDKVAELLTHPKDKEFFQGVQFEI